MIVATLGFSNLTLARRLPPKNMPGGIFNVKEFKNPAFTIYSFSAFVCFLGIYTGMSYNRHSTRESYGGKLTETSRVLCSADLHRRRCNANWNLTRFLVLPCQYRQRQCWSISSDNRCPRRPLRYCFILMRCPQILSDYNFLSLRRRQRDSTHDLDRRRSHLRLALRPLPIVPHRHRGPLRSV